MLKRLEVFYIASIFIFITAVILIIYTMQRETEYKSHYQNLEKSVVQGAAYAINLQLQNKHKQVRLFLDEYADTIAILSRNPNDEVTEDSIRHRLQQRFSDFFTFTITGLDGEHMLQDIDSLVGDVCQQDLDNFSRKIRNNYRDIQNKIFVHPQAFHYHYDVMAPLLLEQQQPKIFFTSFYLDEITDILKTHETPGQNLMLVRQSEPTLIEINREGGRDKFSRDIHLTEDELLHISAHENIPETDWRLISLHDDRYEKQYLDNLWKEVVIILGIVTLALFLFIIVIFKLANKSR